jgi:hypothetical protein
MTLEQLISRIRELSRVDAGKTSESVLMERIEDALRIFSLDVYGFPKEEYPILPATFNTNTNYRLRFLITGGTNALSTTDVAITDTIREQASGDTVASDLQTQLNAAIGTGDVAISFSNFFFTFDTTASSVSTAFNITAPDAEDYLNAQDLMGVNGNLTEASTGTFTGDFPQGCTRRFTLTREPLTIQTMWWERYEMFPAPRNYFIREYYTGEPLYWYQEGKTVLITPAPQRQKELYVAYKAIAELDNYQGYQEVGLSSKTMATDTGLTASTQYYFKITTDGNVQEEYDITTTTNVTFDAVIDAINTAIAAGTVTGVTCSLVGGDMRFTSNQAGADSNIALAAGTSGTDLFATLTGWSAFDTAVAGTSTLPDEIPTRYHDAIAYYVAGQLLMETFETQRAGERFAVYRDFVRKCRVDFGNRNTAFAAKEAKRLWWRYTGRDSAP